ncbi:amidohydrolase family protein [Natrialbaceae archaeon A-chndr2]
MSERTAFLCGVLIDGVADEPRSDAVVLVENGTIIDVGPADSIDTGGVTVVDHRDEIVMPGMIDAHLHLKGWPSMDQADFLTYDVSAGAARATGHLRDLLAAGFTSVRDVDSRTGLGLKKVIEEGTIQGPRVYTSDRAIYQTGGHGDVHYLPYEWVKEWNPYDPSLCDGADECRKEARKRIRDGVDLIKIGTTGGVLSEKDHPHHSQMTDEEIAAITHEAHRVEIPVAAHAQGAEGVKNALRNGVDTIEHGIYLDDECLELFNETNGILVPTLSIVNRICEHGEEHGIPDFGLKKAREAHEEHIKSVRRAYEADVTIALGTDFVGTDLIPHGENAEEMVLYVEKVGMDPMDSIKTATANAAKTVPDSKIGTIEEGKYADLVVLSEDPLKDITAVQDSVISVYKEGRSSQEVWPNKHHKR